MIPAHWIKGSLVDLRRFTDGSFRATLLGEEPNPENPNWIDFPSGWEAQNWVSDWYNKEQQLRV